MLKKLFTFILIAQLMACSTTDLQNAMGTILGSGELTNAEMSSGLKEALNFGISKGSDLLSQKDGYFKSPYKVLLPEEARKVTDKLQNIPGFSEVENVILEKINRGAEDAAKKAKPIFVNAIKQMSFTDVLDILMGTEDAATRFLERTTYDQLYKEFNPVIIESLDKFNARQYWGDAVNTYNKIPFINKVDTELGDYVTKQALNGLFSMVQKEETNIRRNVSARTTELLKRVFAKQDNR